MERVLFFLLQKVLKQVVPAFWRTFLSGFLDRVLFGVDFWAIFFLLSGQLLLYGTVRPGDLWFAFRLCCHVHLVTWCEPIISAQVGCDSWSYKLKKSSRKKPIWRAKKYVKMAKLQIGTPNERWRKSGLIRTESTLVLVDLAPMELSGGQSSTCSSLSYITALIFP